MVFCIVSPIQTQVDSRSVYLLSEDALHRIQSRLLESMSLIQHFPHVSLFSESSKMLAQLKLDQAEDQWEIAATLGEAAAVSLRHQYLAHYQKQIR